MNNSKLMNVSLTKRTAAHPPGLNILTAPVDSQPWWYWQLITWVLSGSLPSG